MSKITRSEVEHIAMLSRLALKPDELDRYTEGLNEMLEYAAKIQELDTSDVPPTAHAIPMANVWREDRVEPSLGAESALANTADRVDDFYRVPKVTEAL